MIDPAELDSTGKLTVTLKSGQKALLDFSNYTYMEYTYNNTTIHLASSLRDPDGTVFIVHSIQMDAIILKDSEGNLYNYPKEEINHFIIEESNE